MKLSRRRLLLALLGFISGGLSGAFAVMHSPIDEESAKAPLPAHRVLSIGSSATSSVGSGVSHYPIAPPSSPLLRQVGVSYASDESQPDCSSITPVPFACDDERGHDDIFKDGFNLINLFGRDEDFET